MRGLLISIFVIAGLAFAPSAYAKADDCGDALALTMELTKKKTDSAVKPLKQQPRVIRRRKLSGPILM